MAAAVDKSHVVSDVEEGGVRRSSVGGGGDGYFDAGGERLDDEEQRSSSESGTEIVEGRSSVSSCSVEVDLESGLPVVKVHLAKVERDCRICHLTLDATNHESGIPIELGCSCKDDLAAAHKQCAEAWFKIRGNK